MHRKVSGLGDLDTPTHAARSHAQWDQQVRRITASHPDQVLGLPHAPTREAAGREDTHQWAAPGGARSRLPRSLG